MGLLYLAETRSTRPAFQDSESLVRQVTGFMGNDGSAAAELIFKSQQMPRDRHVAPIEV